MRSNSCQTCGSDLAGARGRGRPASYCSPACRRTAEYGLRRAQRAIESVEKSARWHREVMAAQPDASFVCCGRGGARDVHVAWLDVERVRLEGVLRGMFESGARDA